MKSSVGIPGGEWLQKGGVRVTVKSEHGQGRAEDQQFCTSLIGEAGAENGLEVQGNGVPDAAGGPATVR